ncbi:GNAT family N-acetyltransferase [Zhouia amylolytica]|uniref:GCN5-related N-acetyltransferase n=1 Tax=Zhouia amylolytica AD3 TaxID=1286632 RepID=W2UN37_9FLAO|nr:GNAT family N-acetyltransferase [Zhouia amylolytica]ETN95359.1 GCN5-related N-acetyltransferase [Zhouia amylolytica AD3]
MQELKIIPFKPEYAKDFKDINIEWLQKYFFVEQHDMEVLDHAETYIIGNGGHIFFAKHNDAIIGTVALIKIEEGIFELSKMGVVTEQRDLKVGQKLMQYALDFAREKKWKKLIIYSSTKLENAIHIYRKFGFKEIPVENNCSYLRCDIKMELPVTT